MNPDAPPHADLHTLLQGLGEQPPLADYLCVTARREHGVHAARVERPTLGVVLHGHKRLSAGAFELPVAMGEVFIVTRPCRLSAHNAPDPGSGLYLTLAVPLCDEVLHAARLLWAAPPTAAGPLVLRFEAERLRPELQAWAAALHEGQWSAARLALAALLLRLCEWGHDGILTPEPPTAAARLREMVDQQPARRWRSQDFEAALGLSGATLRRRLAQERTSVTDAVAEARMTHALNLLYTTRWPLKTVAARVGYRSAASFARRFAARYGMEPGAIGNA